MVRVLHCNRGGEKFEKFGVSPGSAFPRDIFYGGHMGTLGYLSARPSGLDPLDATDLA